MSLVNSVSWNEFGHYNDWLSSCQDPASATDRHDPDYAMMACDITFFDDLRALTRYWVFDSWEQWFDFMLRGLELTPPT